MTNQQHAFVTEYLRHRSEYTAYCLAFNLKDCSNFEGIMQAAQQLMDRDDIGGLIRSVLKGIRQDVEEKIKHEQRTDILTTQRKREILAKIATGEMYAVQVYKGKDCTQCTQHVWPTINQMLKAIDLDNKMVGLYTVKQSAATNPQFRVDDNQLTKAGEDNISQQNLPTAAATPEVEHTPETGNTQNNNISQQNLPPAPTAQLVENPRRTEKQQHFATNTNSPHKAGSR